MKSFAMACAVLLVSACAAEPEVVDPSKMDQPAEFACQDFAEGYESAVSSQARLDLADKVNEWAPKSQTNLIADMGEVLVNGAEGSDAAWQMAADAFAQSCIDAGWGS